MKKKFISALIVLSMLLSLIPSTVYADYRMINGELSGLSNIAGLDILLIGQTSMFSATPTRLGAALSVETMEAQNIAIEWETSDPSVLNIDNGGFSDACSASFVGVSSGVATVTARITLDEVEYTESLEVRVQSRLISIVANDATPLTIGAVAGSKQYSVATIVPETTDPGTWSIENNEIAIVDDTGLVTACTVGTTNLIYTVGDSIGKYPIAVSLEPGYSEVSFNVLEGAGLTEKVYVPLGSMPATSIDVNFGLYNGDVYVFRGWEDTNTQAQYDEDNLPQVNMAAYSYRAIYDVYTLDGILPSSVEYNISPITTETGFNIVTVGDTLQFVAPTVTPNPAFAGDIGYWGILNGNDTLATIDEGTGLLTTYAAGQVDVYYAIGSAVSRMTVIIMEQDGYTTDAFYIMAHDGVEEKIYYTHTQNGEMPDTSGIPYDIPDTETTHYTFTGWTPEITETAGIPRNYWAMYNTANIEMLTLGAMTSPVGAVVVGSESASIQLDTPTANINFAEFGLTAVWSSNDEQVATVDSNGLVTFHTAGIVMITYTVGTKSVSCSVRGVSAEGYGTITFIGGDGLREVQLVAVGETPVPTIDTTRTNTARESYTFTGWSQTIEPVPVGDPGDPYSRDMTYMAVYDIEVHTRHVVFQYENGEEIKAADVPVTDMPSAPTPANYASGGKWYTFIGWTPAVVPVEEGVGAIFYTAQYNNGVNLNSANITITIGQIASTPVAGGDAVQLSATADPTPEALGQDIVWSVDKSSIATIDENGLLTPLAAGIVTVTATLKNTSESVQVQVENPDGYHTVAYIIGDVPNTSDLRVTYRLVEDGTMPPEVSPAFINTNYSTVYIFDGWHPTLAAGSRDRTYTAQYHPQANTVYAIFKNGEEEITRKSVVAGNRASYDEDMNGTPYKTAQGDVAYVFSGWSPSINVPIFSTTVFEAQFNEVPRADINYNIIIPDSASLATGDTLTLDVTTEPEGLLHTESVVWSTSDLQVVDVNSETGEITGIGEGVATVTISDGVKSQSCFVSVTDTTYAITWSVAGNQTVERYLPGQTPVYSGETPAKPATGTRYYTFDGWYPSIRAANADATYTAQFREWLVPALSLNEEQLNLQTGDSAVLILDIDPAENNAHEAPVWSSSNESVATVDEDGNVEAVGEGSAVITCRVGPKSVRCNVTVVDAITYTITWMIDGTMYQNQCAEGEIPVYDGPTPTKAATAQYTYVFAGWEPTLREAYQDKTYNAYFTQQTRKYTVTFNPNYEGAEPIYREVEYNGIVEVPDESPVKPDDARHSYTFMGWVPFSALYSPIKSDTTFTAEYYAFDKSHIIIRRGNEDAPDSLEILVGGNDQLDAEISPAGAVYHWSSSDESVVTVNDSGLVTAVGKGTATVTLSSFDGSMTDTIEYTVTRVKHNIVFSVDGVDHAYLVEEGDTPVYNGSTDKAPDNEYVYTFLGWDNEIVPAYSDATYTARYKSETRKYKVTWSVQGETIEQEYTFGRTPTYPGTEDSLKMPGDERESHLFTGWSPAITQVTEDVTYTAQYQDVMNIFVITWRVGDIVTREEYGYGDAPTYKGSTDKESSETTVYTFNGWQKPLAPVTESTTYVAQYTETVRKYTIRWNVDGNYTTEQYEYNQTPTYKGGTPTKTNTSSRTYTFIKWNPVVTNVTADATYTAEFKEEIKKYEITFRNWDNTELEKKTVEAGTKPTYTGTTPTRASTTNTEGKTVTYTFVGWTPEITTATENTSYVAQFTASDGSLKRSYTITFKDWDGTVLSRQLVQQGTLPVYSGKTPTRAETKTTKYTFVGWTPELAEVKKDATYTAKYITNSPTEWSLTASEIATLANSGHGANYDFTDGSLYVPAEALDTLAGYKESVTISVTKNKNKGTVTVTIAVDGQTINDKIEGLLLYTDALKSGNVVKVARGNSSNYTTEMFSAVTSNGVYTRINGTCTVTTATENAYFTDLSSSAWASDDIAAIAARGIMVGTGYGQFEPQGNVTRAQTATILYRIANNPRFVGGTAYNDVDTDSWYVREVFWSSSANIIPGAANGLFGPDIAITREDIVTGLHNLTTYLGYTVAKGEAKLGSYKDAGLIDSTKIEAFRWAVDNGIVYGTSSTTLSPKAQTTRAEMAALINRYMAYVLQTEAASMTTVAK